MNKKLLLLTMACSVGLSMYPASVVIKNLTDEPVWVRVNDQKRDTLIDKVSWSERVWGFLERVPLAGGPLHRYPDFRKIKANAEKYFKTGFLNFDSISKVTFLRVKGDKRATGTLKYLHSQVWPLTSKYGNIQLHRWKKGIRSAAGGGISVTEYINGFNGQKQRWESNLSMEPTEKYTITIPELDEFTYSLSDKQIMSNEKGEIELKKWDDAIRTK